MSVSARYSPDDVSDGEKKFRAEFFKDINDVLEMRLSCTICKDDVKKQLFGKGRAYIHRLLGVLVCKNCYQYYGKGEFSVDEDGSERYCRWCGQGGLLYLCSSCPLSICKKCIKQNMPRSEQRNVESEDWKCFCCDPKPLYELRAMAWAFRAVMAKSKGKTKDKGSNSVEKKLTAKEVEMKKCRDSVCDSIKRVQVTCRSLDKKLLHIQKGFIDSTDVNVLKESFEKYLSELEKATSTFVECKKKCEKSLNEDIVKLESIQDESNSCAGENGVPSDDESLHNTIESDEETQSNDKNAKQDIDGASASGAEKDDSSKVDEVSDSLSKADESVSAAEPNVEETKAEIKDEENPRPMLRIRKIDEINSSVPPSAESDKNKKDVDNNKVGVNKTVVAPEIIVLSDSEGSSSPVKKSSSNRKKSSSNRLSATSTQNQSNKNSSTNRKSNSSDSEVHLIEEESISATSKRSESPQSKKGVTKKTSEEPRSENLEEPDKEKVKDKEGNSNSKIQNGGVRRKSKSEPEKSKDKDDNILVEDTPEDSNTIAKDNSDCNESGSNLNTENSKDASPKKPSNESSGNAQADLDAEKTKGKPKISPKKETKLEAVKPQTTSTDDDSSSSDSSSGEDLDDEVRKDTRKRKVTTKKSQIVKGLLTSTESDLTDFEIELTKKPKKNASVKKTPVQRTEKKIKKEDKDPEEENCSDPEFKRLMNTKGLSKVSRQSKSFSEKSKDLPAKKNKKKPTKKPVQSLLDELEGEDGLDKLRGDVRRILLSLPGANSCPDLPKMDFDFSSDDEDDSTADAIVHDSLDSDGIDDLLGLNEKGEVKKKKKSDKKVKTEKPDSDASDKESVGSSKNDSWKKDKLLNVKLSDSSDDDIFNTSNEKKKKSVVVIDSDDSEGSKKKSKPSEPVSSLWTSSDSDDVPDKNVKKRKRIKKRSSDSSDESMETSTPKGRKNIKKIKKSDDLNETTQSALKAEQERKQRIAERQKLYNELMMSNDFKKCSKVEHLVLEFDLETKKERIVVDADIVKKLKPHQAEGIKFMWESCFETVSKAKKGKGSGCILAHCMGLGKTLQVIALLHTLMKYDELKVKTALILCPLSTVLNWASEFSKWLSDVGSGEDIDVFHFTKSTAVHRSSILRDWQRRGGVMIMGYSLFRILVTSPKRIKPAFKTAFLETLTDPGPDIVICDEGHILKNESTSTSKSVSKIRSLRRIVLTGTPLQNNLIEYHCMVQFVKPELLGTKKDFLNRFVNPIQNGQFVDSTPQDVKIMKRRAHVLHKMLDGIVQRKDYNVLVPFLPPKFEFVLGLNLTELQIKLYRTYLEKFAQQTESKGKGAALFKDKSILQLICSHPRLLRVHSQMRQMKELDEETDEEGSLKDFIDDGEDSSSSSATTSSSSSNSGISIDSEKVTRRRNTRNTKVASDKEGSDNEVEEVTSGEWWGPLIAEDEMEDIRCSTKLFLLFKIIEKCNEIGDKLLVFSQSLFVLDLIEHFLLRIDEESYSDDPPAGLAGFKGVWIKGLDYFRLDGATTLENRAMTCNKFNDMDNLRSRLFLISTRAGGMGINLTGANRVVIFDASWNPSHDVQSIFRIYRFGQEKPCYIYRFLSKGTMEQKVYDRQVTKLSLSCRVIDEQQIDRHFTFDDLNELYNFTPNEKDDKTFIVPKDRLLADILSDGKELVLSYHSHDSLLENQADEELNEEERQAAWSDFENEKKRQTQPSFGGYNNYMEIFNKALMKLKLEHPDWTEIELRKAANDIVMTVFNMNKVAPSTNQPILQAHLLQPQQHLQEQALMAQQVLQQQMLWKQAVQQNQMMQQNMMQGNPIRMQQPWQTRYPANANFVHDPQQRFKTSILRPTVYPQMSIPNIPSTSNARKPTIETVNLDES